MDPIWAEYLETDWVDERDYLTAASLAFLKADYWVSLKDYN